MLNHRLLQPEGVLVLEPDSPPTAADFEDLAKEIDPYLAEHGKLAGLMIHVTKFPGWANLDTFRTHMQFVKDHIRNVDRIAFVSDSGVLTEIPKMVAHLVKAEIKDFPQSEYDEALQWLKASAPLPNS
ncbi:MAG: STAS/SEC14 domain-containing protein [Abditibacteriaceae bacterium]